MSQKAAIETLRSHLSVSRETLERLEAFTQILLKWNEKINLIGKSTLSDVWARHILDSAQLEPHLPETTRRLADIGSGGGLPAIVLAIIAAETDPERRTILVEADRRKAAFLTVVTRELGLNAEISTERIESLDPINADALTARAVAPLSLLLKYAERHLSPGGVALFLKGANFVTEIEDALATWRYTREETPSLTADGAVILKIGEITRV